MPHFEHSAGGGDVAEWAEERSDVAAIQPERERAPARGVELLGYLVIQRIEGALQHAGPIDELD